MPEERFRSSDELSEPERRDSEPFGATERISISLKTVRRDERTGVGSVPLRYAPSKISRAEAASPDLTARHNPAAVLAPVRPTEVRTRSSVISPRPRHWSRRERESRIAPSPRRARREAAPSVIASPSACATYFILPSISRALSLRNENR